MFADFGEPQVLIHFSRRMWLDAKDMLHRGEAPNLSKSVPLHLAYLQSLIESNVPAGTPEDPELFTSQSVARLQHTEPMMSIFRNQL